MLITSIGLSLLYHWVSIFWGLFLAEGTPATARNSKSITKFEVCSIFTTRCTSQNAMYAEQFRHAWQSVHQAWHTSTTFRTRNKAMILLICSFDNLHIHILLEIFILLLLTLQVVAIEVVAGAIVLVVVELVNVAVTVAIILVCRYCLLVSWSSLLVFS